MANASIIPPLNCRGLYTFNSPWVSDLTRVYVCTAIRRFSDLAAQGEDVFTLYYQPNGLTQTDYATDAALGAVIITLENDYSAPIYIPSTYIVSFPDMSAVSYNHVVVSISLGALYDGIALDFLTQQLAQDCTAVIGVTPTVLVNTAPLKSAVTPEEHQVIEAARNAAITNRTTDAQRIVSLQQQLDSAQATISAWQSIADSNGWTGN